MFWGFEWLRLCFAVYTHSLSALGAIRAIIEVFSVGASKF
jgi:hypothetical protein